MTIEELQREIETLQAEIATDEARVRANTEKLRELETQCYTLSVNNRLQPYGCEVGDKVIHNGDVYEIENVLTLRNSMRVILFGDGGDYVGVRLEDIGDFRQAYLAQEATP